MANVDYAYPLDSIVNYDGNGVPSFDRAVSSLVLRRLYSYLFTKGVWMATDSTALQVGVAEGMKVSVNAGFTVINGALRLFAEPRTLAIQASENQDRIDTVVARLDLNQDVRNIDLYVLKGTSGSTPVRPELTRNDSVYELGLADLFIPAGTTTIPQERITDTRLDTARCGVVSSISEFDTTTLYNQIQADLAHFKSENEAEFEAWVNGQESTFATWSSTQRSAFETWFAGIRDILDEDTAGHLQGEIEALQGDMNTAKARLGKELTATLTAGSTALTFTDASITSDTIVDNVLASVQGFNYESIEVEEGALTMTFDEQAVDVSVKVVIR
jgi:hypothetical protein